MPTARAYSTLALFFICATTAAKIEGSRKQRVAPRQVARAADTKLSEVVDLDVGEMDSSGRRGHRSTIRRYKRRGSAPFMGSLSTIGQFSFQGNHEEEDMQAESLGEASLGRAVSVELATAKRFSPHGNNLGESLSPKLIKVIGMLVGEEVKSQCAPSAAANKSKSVGAQEKTGPSKGPFQELPDYSPSAMQRMGRNHKVNTAFISKFRRGLSPRDKSEFDRKRKKTSRYILSRSIMHKCATALLKPLYYDGKNGMRGKRNLHRICTR